ncbi:hypothetical protein V6N11_025174 [Hibiscus sabdariffa]|uniref:non-specific serine/threonine protein kinase n=1 Tax=Hibiscus sabdariffa TaxID=183260 RepID=A0ABR2QPA7_9ROSI
MEHYEIMEQIGCVAFGAVILVHHKSENKKYVLKKIILVQQTSVARDRLIKKAELIKKIKWDLFSQGGSNVLSVNIIKLDPGTLQHGEIQGQFI